MAKTQSVEKYQPLKTLKQQKALVHNVLINAKTGKPRENLQRII